MTKERLIDILGYHFAAQVSGNNQPHMSGDPRNRLLPHRRRRFDDACAQAADAILAAQQDGGWQPIETAPMETPVNIFVPVNRPGRRVLSAYRDDAGWTILSGSIVIGRPTHWKHLPAGPEQGVTR